MDFKNNKGFTLIELLAVIVVLGIIMVIALNSVLPLIDDARESGFISSANSIVEATRQADLAQSLVGGVEYDCYYIDYLINQERVERISVGDFKGHVLVQKNSAGSDEYVISINDVSNGFYVYNRNATTGGNIVVADILHSAPSEWPTDGACPTTLNGEAVSSSPTE